MYLEIVTVGTELLLGFTVDGNAAELGRQLAGVGVAVVRRATVPDEPDAIAGAVREALARTGVVITTGGLGPTADDLTRPVVAGVLGRPLRFRDDVWDEIVARFARFGRTAGPSNRSQAEVPEGAVVLNNRWGSAPGLWIEAPVPEAPDGRGLVILLPGVPHEMRMLLEHEVLPRLVERAGDSGVIRSRAVRTIGVPESTLAERLAGIEAALAPLTLAYIPGAGRVDLRLTAWHLPAAEADERLAAAVERVAALVGPGVWGRDDDELAALVLAAARRRRWTVATAESCTAGLVSARLTDVAGSSDVVAGGVVAYSNALKHTLLGVPEQLLAAHGAVSEEVARAMAHGARALGADLAVAITGIAGPEGGTPEKPVGTVWLAVDGPDGSRAELRRFQGSRATIRERATEAALALLLATADPTTPLG